jgi:type IV fimbrial biogenesis protein FimT
MKIKYLKTVGFSIIELMVVIAIAGIMTAVALPSYTEMVKNNCMTSTVNRFVSSIQLARTEAIKLRQNVTVDSLNGTEWAGGWQVNDNVPSLISQTDITCGLGNNTTFTGTTNSLTYDSEGFLIAAVANTFTFCDDRVGETGRVVTVNPLGRPSTVTQVCP